MNFNDINGVWPQIKDYIDSKLGGGENKYKHMIYVTNLLEKEYPPHAESSLQDAIESFLSNGYFCVTENRFIIGAGNNYSLSSGYTSPAFETLVGEFIYDDVTYCEVVCLREGWFINYCGQIYDYQGNIVE